MRNWLEIISCFYFRYKSLTEQKMQLLRLWKQQKSSKATTDRLLKTLIKVEQREIAEQVAESLDLDIDDYYSSPEQDRRSVRSQKVPNQQNQRNLPKKERTRIENGHHKPVQNHKKLTSQSSDSSYLPSSPDVETRQNGLRGVSESSEGYHSSGSQRSNRVHSRGQKGSDPQRRISPIPDVENSAEHLNKPRAKRPNASKQKHKLKSADSSGSLNSNNSDLIVSEGGSDAAVNSDSDSDGGEVVTTPALDCSPEYSSHTLVGDIPSSPESMEPASPDCLLNQTVPKRFSDSYNFRESGYDRQAVT